MARAEKETSGQEGGINLGSCAARTQGDAGSMTSREKILFRMSLVRTACAVVGAAFSTISGLVALYMFWKIFIQGGH